MLELVAFAVAAGCLLGLSALMVVSLLAPERRLWPAGDDALTDSRAARPCPSQ